MRVLLKNLKVLNLDPLLEIIVTKIMDTLGLNLITSAYRDGDPGVHGTQPVRGIDLRCWDRGVGIAAETWVNALWEYDPKRPEKKVCMFHDVGKGLHLHVQVHPNTVERLAN